MVYVEWLRVRGALKWTAIVLGIVFVLASVARVTVDFHHQAMGAHAMKFGYFLIFGAVVALIVATVLGTPFARENDGHLETTFTKPINRTALALATIGVDVTGIVGALAIGTVFGIALHTIFFPPWITFQPADAIALILGIVGPLAWYAMLAAATSWLKRGYGAIAGIAWPIALIVVGLSLIGDSDNPMLSLIHTTFWALSRLDPLAYIHLDTGDMQSALDPTWLPRLTMLALLAVGYGALAVIAWRRVEA